ncbi:MAG: non-heme iron oxygenase ferredoxin subunit [Micromonosporaceae bacterium]
MDDLEGFVKVCATTEIPAGTVVRAEIDDVPLAVVHAEGAGEADGFYAIYDECSHAEVPLSEGDVEDCTLECWLHGSRFDLETGKPTGLPATEPVPVYPVRVHDGGVYVNLTPKDAA